MSTAYWGRGIVGLITSTLLALALGGPALGEEDATVPGSGVGERLATLEKSVKEHKQAQDSDGLLVDIRMIVVLHGDAARDEKVRKQAVRLLGALTKRGRLCSTVTVAAVEGLGRTADPEGARYLTAHLKRMRRVDKATALMRATVAAAAQLCEDEFIEPLLKVVTNSKDYTLAAQAIQTLSNFRHCKRKRVKILKTIVETTAKDRPGAKGRNKDPVPGDQYRHTGDLARNRWASLSRVLPAALAKLTGLEDMKTVSADYWIEYVRNNKRNLAAVFADDEE